MTPQPQGEDGKGVERPESPCADAQARSPVSPISDEDDDEGDDLDRIFDAAVGTPWEANEHGLWCLNCGNHIAAPWNIRDGYVAPENCGDCGFPEDL